MPLTKASVAAGARSEAVADLAWRIQAEYAEMPGLSLTLAQAERLWTLDRRTCETVFDRLIVLRMTTKGRFVRA